jgi:hypothetical protein
MEMESKYSELPGNGKAAMWLPIMNKIKADTDSLTGIIEDLKANILMQSDDLKVENVAVLNSLSEPTGSGYSLLNKLASFKDSIPAFFNIPNLIAYPSYHLKLNNDVVGIRKASPLLTDYAENLSKEQRNEFINKWLDKNLRGSSALMAMIVLNKLENDMLTISTVLMDYCNDQVGIGDERGLYTSFYVIRSLSSSYVKRGENIEVTAGVGEFSVAAKPRISIDGKEIMLDRNGVARYKFNARGRAGKHSIPVKFEYIADDGKPAIMNEMAEYTIAEDK